MGGLCLGSFLLPPLSGSSNDGSVRLMLAPNSWHYCKEGIPLGFAVGQRHFSNVKVFPRRAKGNPFL